MKYIATQTFKYAGKTIVKNQQIELDDHAAAKLRRYRLIAAKEIEKGTLHAPEKAVEVKKESATPKHVGGGWYELPNGERVQGKENARKAVE